MKAVASGSCSLMNAVNIIVPLSIVYFWKIKHILKMISLNVISEVSLLECHSKFSYDEQIFWGSMQLVHLTIQQKWLNNLERNFLEHTSLCIRYVDTYIFPCGKYTELCFIDDQMPIKLNYSKNTFGREPKITLIVLCQKL